MTDNTDRLNEIRERCEKATPAPWDPTDVGAYYNPDPDDRELPGTAYFARVLPNLHISKEQAQLDAQFVANSRDDIPWLLAKIDRLREQVKAADELARMSDTACAYLNDSIPPPPPGHICGPEGNCDCDCMSRAYQEQFTVEFRKALATYRETGEAAPTANSNPTSTKLEDGEAVK